MAACCLAVYGSFTASGASAKLERVEISDDGRNFILADSKESFRIWGVNYDHDSVGEGRLIEDYWMDEWSTVEEDFREIRELGANVVRIHLQFGRFMKNPHTADEVSLSQLRRLLTLAEQTGLRLDLTGLGCYHKQDVAEWYDAMNEENRWAAQASFWRAVADTCRDSNGVFCYDLMNEPVVSGELDDGWLAGELGGKHFVQRLTLNRRDRTGETIAKAWVERMTDAIREVDPETLITVGVIPWAHVWPNAKPVFYSSEVAEHLDFVSVHFYPKSGEIEKALAALNVYDVGKPLVIEEMFPLHCDIHELDEFVRRSESTADGWIGFYWGRTIEELETTTDGGLKETLVAGWLNYFKDAAPEMRLP